MKTEQTLFRTTQRKGGIKMKKLLSIALVLVLAFAVAACDKGDTSSKSPFDYRDRGYAYSATWLDKSTAEQVDPEFTDIQITRIHTDCFFAKRVVGCEVSDEYEIKLNGELDEKWCVGDIVVCTYKNPYYDKKAQRVEVDMVSIKQSDAELSSSEQTFAKPVIYLYPEQSTDVSVKLDLDGKLTCTYPQYNGGWEVTAAPDGILTDSSGKQYNYLYWEGEGTGASDFSSGFCVKGADTAAFLESALAQLGLTRREANEFIVYWLPIMQENEYNIISFQGETYTNSARLTVSPQPDTTLRVFMAFKASNKPVAIPAQTLSAPERSGFTVVEWGGTQVK